MKSKRLRSKDVFNLERLIKVLETPFEEVCRMFDEEEMEPEGFLEVEDCVFLFDSEKGYVFSGAVIMSNVFGFFGIQVGINWLEAAAKLESQGFKQAEDLERFTKPGSDVGVSVYLYPDDCPDASLSKVKDYSVCVRYGHTL
jgi:hypothetical protein